MLAVQVATDSWTEARPLQRFAPALASERRDWAPSHTSEAPSNALSMHWFPRRDALVVSKRAAGFDEASVSRYAALLRNVACGGFGRLKFLIFDFCHAEPEPCALAATGFETLAATNASLIVNVPVISVAWARTQLAGADLEFALSCSMIVGERGARFSFDADPANSVGMYGLLAQKIGFVKAERLMEGGEPITAEQMSDLFLVRHLAEQEEGFDEIERFVEKSTRRYNSSCNIYRAQRIAMPAIYETMHGPQEDGFMDFGRLSPPAQATTFS